MPFIVLLRVLRVCCWLIAGLIWPVSASGCRYVGDIGPFNIETANKLRTPNKLVSKISIVGHPAGRAAVLKKFIWRDLAIFAFPQFSPISISMLFQFQALISQVSPAMARDPGNRQELQEVCIISRPGTPLTQRHDFQAIHRESR